MEFMLTGVEYIDKTAFYSSLTIADKASITAPEGKAVVMTVDGVNKEMIPGTYTGEVVLNVVDVINEGGYEFKTILCVSDNRILDEKSVMAAVINGDVSDTSIKGAKIVSEEECVNGIYVTGNFVYVIDSPVIDMTGNGGNDFVGYGAAVMATGNAKVTNKARIKTTGAVRTAVFAGGNSELIINDSEIEVFNGKLPDDYTFTVAPGKMKEVPWPLGLIGNCRATNLVGRAVARYNNSVIRAQGWGCLSTDAVEKCELHVTNCTLETIESGYGAYSISDCHDYFSGCHFKVKDIGLIIEGEASGTFTDKTIVDSGRFGVMMHSGSGGGVMTIDKKSVINSGSSAIQVKGRGTKIVVDDAELYPGNGILIQTMENDDPILGTLGKPGGADDPGAGGLPMPGGGPDGPGGPGGPGGGLGGPPQGGGAPGQAQQFSKDVEVELKNANLKGDIFHGMTAFGQMLLLLSNVNLEGAISTTNVTHSKGQPTQEMYYLIGEVDNTLCPSATDYGLKLTVVDGSKWTVTETSYIDSLTLTDWSEIVPPSGKTLIMYINGNKTDINPGSYKGRITLEVK